MSGSAGSQQYSTAVLVNSGFARKKMADGAQLTSAAATGDEKVCILKTVLLFGLVIKAAYRDILYFLKCFIFKAPLCSF